MKKIALSLVSMVALSNFAMAGGDISPVVAPVAEVQSKNVVYVGVGYSAMNMDIDHGTYFSDNFTHGAYPLDQTATDIDANAFMLLAGYKYNQYIGLEYRYTRSFGDLEVDSESGSYDVSGELSNSAIYLKPSYTYENLNLYGLLGYGRVLLSLDTPSDYSESGLQWGLGASYNINEEVSVFVDYTNLYDGEEFDGLYPMQDVTVDSINIGVIYSFTDLF